MKQHLRSTLAAALILFASAEVSSQCTVALTCPGNATANTSTGNCSAVVNYTTPTATNSCTTSGSVTFNYTGSLQTFTVPAGVTTITVDASGAQGGSVTTTCAATGGLGARMVGDISVTPGEVITIMVGQQGLTNGSDAGGGGGTFVVRTGNVPLVVAGGGGGATNNITACGGNRNGIDATITTSGTASANGLVAGGTGGNGGGASSGSGGGGGGFYTDGIAGTGLPGNNGKCFINGGAGGTGNNVDFGGYGGGGAGWFTGGNGGGGGGYSGGGTSGTQPYSGGGGGGSYNSGTNQTNTAGFQTGNGRVIISYVVTAPVTVSLLSGLPSGSAFPVGVNTVTYVATDGLGANDTCSFTVTVTDAESPTPTCPVNITANVDPGMCSAVVNFSPPTAVDNCSVAMITQNSGPSSGSAFPVGTTMIGWDISDASGNTVTCGMTITVTDNEAPVLTCPATMNVNADPGMCSAVVNYSTPTATDNCNVNSVSLTGGPASGSTFPLGTTTISYMAMDATGNFAVCSFDIVVSDAEAPTMVCGGNITTGTDSLLCTAVVTFSAPAATDNCSSVTVTQTGGPASGSAFPIGATTITYTATDSAGNTSTCSFDITVADLDAPIVNCSQDITTCAGQSVVITANATDQCTGVASIDYVLTGATTGSGSGNATLTFNPGVTTVTYTATDSSGNTSNCSFTVTSHPTPTVTTSASSTTPCLNDGLVTLTGLPAGGTWSGPGVSGATFNPMTAGNGTHVLTYTYTDSSGCTNSSPLTIVVNPCVGITENSSLDAMQVAPNPTSGTMFITLGAQYSDIQLSLVDLNGQVVREEKLTNTSSMNFSMENVAVGVYFLTVRADDQVKTIKVIRN